MMLLQYELRPPVTQPFDGSDWFEALVGNVIKPITKLSGISRYWFSRYDFGTGKHALFRLEVDNQQILQQFADPILASFGVQSRITPYDLVGDLGSARFIELSNTNSDLQTRANLVFDYLHAVCALFVDHLVSAGIDRFAVEVNTDFQNQRVETAFESYHHLFCNITSVSTPVFILENGGQQIVESFMQFNNVLMPAGWVNKARIDVHF